MGSALAGAEFPDEGDALGNEGQELIEIHTPGAQGHAVVAGGVRLPLPIRLLMKGVSKIMTKTTYWV